jgi:hypothetical protein
VALAANKSEETLWRSWPLGTMSTRTVAQWKNQLLECVRCRAADIFDCLPDCRATFYRRLTWSRTAGYYRVVRFTFSGR